MRGINNFNRFFYLFIIHRFKGERSIAGIFHVLKGKKSAQTTQDRTLYNVDAFFQSMDWLTQDRLTSQTAELQNTGLIEELEPGHFVLTGQGMKELNALEKCYAFPDGLLYCQFTMEESDYWSRLSLLAQAVSEWTYKNTRYIPVAYDPSVQQDVKEFIRNLKLTKQQITEQLRKELVTAFRALEEKLATILASQLSGHGVYGKTQQQLNDRLGMSAEEGSLQNKAAIRSLLFEVISKPEDYVILFQLYRSIQRGLFTESTTRTYELLQKGCTLDGIGQIRHLKKSTIEDHITEIALYDTSFDILPYVSKEEQAEIVQAYHMTNTNKLRDIKSRVSDSISFFKIRLVIASGVGD